jgi:hypothetical protein
MHNPKTEASLGTRQRTKTKKTRQNRAQKINNMSNMDRLTVIIYSWTMANPQNGVRVLTTILSRNIKITFSLDKVKNFKTQSKLF